MAAVLFAATLAVYAPSLGNDFVNWDDPRYVTESPFATRGPAGIVAAWTTAWDDAWYPLTHSLHALTYAVAGPSPAAHHAVQWLLAGLAVALVPAALRSFGLGTAAAAAGALVWMAHPMRVESFVWVANLKDTLSLVLVLASFAAWGKGRRRVAAIAFCAALLAKTTLFPLATLFFWLDARSFDRRAIVRALWRTAAFWLPALLLAANAARLHVLADAPHLRTVPGGSLAAALPTALFLPWWYVGRTVAFAHPQAIYTFEPVGWLDPRLGIALALWALAIAACVRLPFAARWQRVAALLAFALPFLPVTGLVPLFVHAADRYALHPSLAFTAVVAAGGQATFRTLASCAPVLRRFGMSVAAAAVAASLAVALPITRQRTGEWRDSIALWDADRRRQPEQVLPLRQLAGAYGAVSQWEEVVDVLQAVLDVGEVWQDFGRDWFFAHAALDGMDADLLLDIAIAIEAEGSDPEALLEAAGRAATAGHPAVGEAMRLLYAAMLQ